MIPYLLAVVGGYLLGDSMKESQLFADGGETEDMSIQFIDYKDKTIMFEPHNKEYFTNDIEFKSLADAKKYIDAGSPDPSWQKFVYSHGVMADGGVASQCALDIDDVEVEVESSNFNRDSLVLNVKVVYFIEKLDIFANKTYTFDLYVDYDGYAISSILYDGTKIPKEEADMLESNKYVESEVETAYEKESEDAQMRRYYDDDYADGGEILRNGKPRFGGVWGSGQIYISFNGSKPFTLRRYLEDNYGEKHLTKEKIDALKNLKVGESYQNIKRVEKPANKNDRMDYQ